MVTLVFGIGYIGSRLVQELLYQGREVVGVDNLFSSDRRAIDGFQQLPSFQFIEGSIVNPDDVSAAVTAAHEIEAVYLLAAQSSGDPDAAPADYTEDANLRGPRIVLDALIRHDIRAPVVYASSSRIYGSPLPALVDENTPYGRFTDMSHLSKCYAEKLLEMYCWRYQLPGRVLRLGLTYGVAPVMKVDRRFMTAPNLFCLQAVRGEPLVVRTGDAVALVHVEDAVRGLLWTGEQIHDQNYRVFNLVTGVATIGTVASEVARLAAERELPPVQVQTVANLNGDANLPCVRSALDGSGFSSRRELTEGLGETLDHFLVRGN